MATTELFKCLAKFTKQIHSILSEGGRTALKADLSKLVKVGKGNPFSNEMFKLMNKWDDVLQKLEIVSKQLETGEKTSILVASKEFACSITNLQMFIAGTFVEIGSFVPGPVGVVCSLALAIGCFATGNIPGGFLNLLGAIPFAKCAKFLPKTELLRILSSSGLGRFKPIEFERYMSALKFKIPQFTYTNHLSRLFEKTIQQAQRGIDDVVVGVRKTAPVYKSSAGAHISNGIQREIDNLGLLGEKGFLNTPDVLEAQSNLTFLYNFVKR